MYEVKVLQQKGGSPHVTFVTNPFTKKGFVPEAVVQPITFQYSVYCLKSLI